MVKRIYREYLEGKSLIQIARGLEVDEILTAAGKAKWRPETLKKILQNEKYIGDALLQKTYTVDYLTKKRVKNNGIVPQYYVENNHEAIIPRELYMQVQEEMVRRVNLHSGDKRRSYSSKYALSGIVFCSKCGNIYRRIQWNNRGKHSTVWRCCTRMEQGAAMCDAQTILESDLQDAVRKAINQAIGCKDSFLPTLQENIEMVIGGDRSTEKIDNRLEELQNELIKKANAKLDYEDIANEIYTLREEKQIILAKDAERESVKKRIEDMIAFLNEQSCEMEEYEEQLVRRLVKKVTVYDEKYVVEFKSGMSVDVER